MPARRLALDRAYEFADYTVQALRRPEQPSEVLLDFLDPEHGNFEDVASKPCQWSLLHVFIENLNLSVYEWHSGHSLPECLPEICSLLQHARIDIPQWMTSEEVSDHIEEVDRLIAVACREYTHAAFTVLFPDKQFLYDFQQFVSGRVASLQARRSPRILRADGVLRRLTYIPTWLKRAVFHRDKGRCQQCARDLTGVIEVVDDLRLDHIWPLAKSGSNDPTNFQLLCDDCNQKKRAETDREQFLSFTYW